jgi:glucosamine--fructose-6-phosphate aminotransferase (isomerizing)
LLLLLDKSIVYILAITIALNNTGKTDENAHPHTDYGNRVAITHNGTINNSHELKDALKAQGIKFKSETDTEVIAHLIGQGLDKVVTGY